MWAVARTWWSIRVDLVGGRGEYLWPRPGREFAAARSHSFAQLADAISAAFARWDRAHLYQFVTADGRVIGQPEFDDFGDDIVDPREPLPYLGWGAIPDQYGRESGDDAVGPDPELRDLPPLIQW